MTGYTKAEAKAADRVLATLQTAAYAADDQLDRAIDRVHYKANDKKRYLSRNVTVWKLDTDEARAKVQAVADDEAAASWTRREAAEAVANLDEARTAAGAAYEAIREHEAANYKGWLRFFLVQDGHIHRSTHCSSLRITTRIGWLPELSGETEAEAVAAHGAMLCTKCFPSAPVEWTRGKEAPADQCEGSGKGYVEGTLNRRYRSMYGECAHCHSVQIVTQYGSMRKHKLPK